jgi:V8-like Glu-specific endopeptidase
MSIPTIGGITNTFSEFNFDKESKKEEIEESKNEEIEESEEKAFYQPTDMRFNLYQLNNVFFNSDFLNRIKEQAKSIACIVPFDKFKKEINYSSNKEYVWNDVPTLEKRLKNVYKYPLSDDSKNFCQEPSPAIGTAFLVCDKRTVLTAAHCLCEENSDQIDSKKEQNYCLVFNFQIDEKKNYKQKFKENEIYKIKKVISHYKDTGDLSSYGDWALLKLDKEVIDGTPLDLDFSDIKPRRRVYMLGHPSGLPLKAAIYAEIKKASKDENLFESNIDGFVGNSGSPLFDQATGKVIGLYINGRKDYAIQQNQTTGKLECQVRRITNEEIKIMGYEKCQKINSIFSIPLYMNYLSNKQLLSSNNWQLLSWKEISDIIDKYDSDKKKIETHKHKKSYQKIYDSALQIIEKQNFANITSLIFYGKTYQVTDEEMKSVEKLTNLTSLDLSWSLHLTDTGLESLENLTNLTSLNLHACRKFTDIGLLSLENLTNLTSLNLNSCWQLTDIGLQSLEKLTHLTSLDLDGCHELTDAGIKSLAKLTHLTSLNLNACRRLTDTGIKSLAKLTHLTSLNLFGCYKLTDTGSLEKLTFLTSLNLSWCQLLTDTGVKSLKKLTNLTSLDLCGCTQLTDTGIKNLEKLTNLTSLSLGSWYGLTDTGIKSLEKLTNLTSLNLNECHKLSSEAVDNLKNKLGIK